MFQSSTVCITQECTISDSSMKFFQINSLITMTVMYWNIIILDSRLYHSMIRGFTEGQAPGKGVHKHFSSLRNRLPSCWECLMKFLMMQLNSHHILPVILIHARDWTEPFLSLSFHIFPAKCALKEIRCWKQLTSEWRWTSMNSRG